MAPTLIGWLIGLSLAVPLAAQTAGVPESGAIYEYRRWHYLVSSGGFRATFSEKVTILNERGQEYARLSFQESQHNKLKSVAIKVLDASGRVVYERGKGDLEKICGYDRTAFYTDDCWYTGTFQSQAYPYSVEYEAVTESESLFFLMGCVFQLEAPVKQAVYSLEMKEGTPFRYKTYGLAAGLEPELGSGGSVYTWSLGMLPALEDIDHLPPGSSEPARLAITPAAFDFEKYHFDGTSWNEVTKSLIQLYEDRFISAPDTGQISDGKAAAGVARACYDAVRKDVRYVAIEVGLGGWRPHPADLTQQRGFGDCKDMTTLLVSRLRDSGIEAYPAFVLTRDKGPLDPEFPTFNFDHVITLAIVNGDSVWLDPTSDVCPYGELPLGDQDIDVLAGAIDGGRLCRTPSSSHMTNLRHRVSRLHLSADLTLKLSCEVSVTGPYAMYLRHTLPSLDKDETRRFIDNLMPGGSKKFAVEQFAFTNLDSLDRPVSVTINATLRKAARRISKIIYCPSFVLAELAGYETIDLSDRASPVSVYYPESEVDEVTLTWDSSLVIDSVILPDTDSLVLPFGDMRIETSQNGDQISLKLCKRYSVYKISPDQFADFATYRKRLREFSDLQVKLITH